MSQLSKAPVITMDGSSGVGKGTIGLLLASRLGWHFLDSGAIYRVLAFAARRSQVNDEDESGLVQLSKQLQLAFKVSRESVSVLLDQQDISRAIRTEDISQAASKVAAFPLVRQALLETQRKFQTLPGLIADGRDMGTTVFPDAPLKFFLTATAEERARRRQKQLKEQGIDVKLLPLIDELEKRDTRDSTRLSSPLVPARDAVIVDTTHLSIEEVTASVWQTVCRKHLV